MITRRRLTFSVAILASLMLVLVLASGAFADGNVTWGVSGVTPTMDTANGDYADSKTRGVTPGSACPNGEACGPEDNPLTGDNPILPAPFSGEDPSDAPHTAEDLAVWTSGVTAPTGGQITQVQLTGCAVEDTNSPTQQSQGTPVNTILFQTLNPSGANWKSDQVSGQFQLPFCNNSTNNDGASASTVTTYQPIHMCVSAGEALAVHDIGGFVSDSSGSYYPQGIPLEILASVKGSSTDSFVGISDTYGPGIYGTNEPEPNEAGYATESGQEVTMQITEGTGDDAYGLCPGGFGDEPANSNSIDCDYSTTDDGSGATNPSKNPDHGWCPGSGPASTSGSGSGTGTSGSGSGTGTGSSGGSGTGSGTGTGTKPATAPVLTKLRSNPPRFLAKNGTQITYVDSQAGVTTLDFYILKGKKWKLVRTVTHQDKRGAAGIRLKGFKPGQYLLKATTVYQGLTSSTYTARFTVVAHR